MGGGVDLTSWFYYSWCNDLFVKHPTPGDIGVRVRKEGDASLFCASVEAFRGEGTTTNHDAYPGNIFLFSISSNHNLCKYVVLRGKPWPCIPGRMAPAFFSLQTTTTVVNDAYVFQQWALKEFIERWKQKSLCIPVNNVNFLTCSKIRIITLYLCSDKLEFSSKWRSRLLSVLYQRDCSGSYSYHFCE